MISGEYSFNHASDCGLEEVDNDDMTLAAFLFDKGRGGGVWEDLDLDLVLVDKLVGGVEKSLLLVVMVVLLLLLSNSHKNPIVTRIAETESFQNGVETK